MAGYSNTHEHWSRDPQSREYPADEAQDEHERRSCQEDQRPCDSAVAKDSCGQLPEQRRHADDDRERQNHVDREHGECCDALGVSVFAPCSSSMQWLWMHCMDSVPLTSELPEPSSTAPVTPNTWAMRRLIAQRARSKHHAIPMSGFWRSLDRERSSPSARSTAVVARAGHKQRQRANWPTIQNDYSVINVN